MSQASTAPPEEPLSTPELKLHLRRLMTRGLPATRPTDVEPLLELHAVRILALVDLPSARLAALHARIHELTQGTRGELLRRLAPYAFGTYSVENFPLEVRLDHAAMSGVGRGRDSLRQRYLGELAADFADRLSWLEQRLRYNDWLNRPGDPAVHDETLRKYDFYTAMAFWLEAAGNDLTAALDAAREPNEDEFLGFAYSALWQWTKFLRYSHRYDEAFFGDWQMQSRAALEKATSANFEAEVVPPFTPLDRSFLRIELVTAYHEELAPFVDALDRHSQGTLILERWRAWLRSCQCPPDEHGNACSVGQFVKAAKSFFEVVASEVIMSGRIDRAARFQTLPSLL